MLVLGRHLKQRVVAIVRDAAGNEICRMEVEVVRGQNVRLGFHCPGNVELIRKELLMADDSQGGKPDATN
jgi:sRNA-binding carbon storage regulator CsrA